MPLPLTDCPASLIHRPGRAASGNGPQTAPKWVGAAEATLVAGGPALAFAGEAGLTTAGSTLGTLAYMAPERFNSGQSDTRSDIYALTCVFYECLTGKRPYPSDSLEQQIAGHLMSTPPRPSDDDPSLAAFDSIIAKGMAKDPDDRYQTGRDLAVAVRAAVDEPRVRAPRGRGRHSAGEPLPRSRSRRTAVLAALA